jgi:sugar lactone lactonase YvrE
MASGQKRMVLRRARLTSNGSYLSQFGSSGGGNGQFNNPFGVAVDSTDNIWVADTQNYRVQKFNSSGSFVLAFGSKGSTNGKFNYPQNIAVDSSGNPWVADNNNSRVQEFNGTTGAYITQIAVAVPGNVDANGNIWTTNAGTNQVQEFNTSGSNLLTIGSTGTGNGQFSNAGGLAIH